MKVPNRPDITHAVGKFAGTMIFFYLLLTVIPIIIFLVFLVVLFS